jgi:hypothetical protein
MKLKDLTKKSVFSSVGTLLREKDIDNFFEYVNYNKELITEFPYILYSFNGEKSLCDIAEKDTKKLFPNSHVEFIFSENLGHTFGIFLSENLIFEKTKTFKDCDYVWKFSNDVIATTQLLEVEVEPSDFYYINNVGYNSFRTYKTIEELNADIKAKKVFYPQTNYYIIKNNIIFYPEIRTIYELYNTYKAKNDKNLKPWDVISHCDCESFLKETVIKNHLSSHMLLTDEELYSIAKCVYDYQLWDGSHKNIGYERLGNLCHFQWKEKEIVII